jgi:hypothetical protein
VFFVCAHWHASMQNTDTLHGEQLWDILAQGVRITGRITYVVSSVGVIIHATKESCCRILANELGDKMCSSRMFRGKCSDIVDEAGNEDQWAFGALLLEAFPRDDRKIIRVLWPCELLLCRTKLLEFHGKLTLADFVFGEDLEVGSEAKLGHDPDEPLCGVVLVPLDGVTVVHRELVVEVVVTFTDGGECGDHVVAGSVLVVKGSLA